MSRSTDRGETLIEVLIAVMILGAAVVVLLGGLGTGIRVSDIHRQQAGASTHVRAFAEAVESAVAGSPSAYRDCAAPGAYAGAYTVGDPGYVAEVLSVRYWNGTAFAATCPGTDTGVQRLSLQVRSTDNLATESLDIIIRKPCRSLVDFPLDLPCV